MELPRPRPLLGDAPEFGAYVNRIYHHFERGGVLPVLPTWASQG